MPQISDSVEIVFHTPGGPWTFNGQITRVNPPVVEISVPTSANPVSAPIVALVPTGPNAWRIEFAVTGMGA